MISDFGRKRQAGTKTYKARNKALCQTNDKQTSGKRKAPGTQTKELTILDLGSTPYPHPRAYREMANCS